MTGKKRYILIGLCLCIMTMGCMNLKQPAYELSYYTLEYLPLEGSALPPLPVVLQVAPFGVAPAYDTHRIVYRDAPFERNTYVYHRWRTHPGNLVSHRLRQDLMNSGLFTAVLTTDNNLPCDYTLTGTVDEFFEWKEARSSRAVLSISVTLVGTDSDRMEDSIRFHNAYRIKESFARKDPPALVEAMSRAMARLSKKILTDLHHYMAHTHERKDSNTTGSLSENTRASDEERF